MTAISEKAKHIRRSPEYKVWRDTILKRDNYQCVLCKSIEQIEVDHIKPFALYPQLALNLDNGRVLCHKCHKKTDTYGHLTKFKNEENPIHPLLSGDLLYKIESLPSSIEINGKTIGLSIKYEPNNKVWCSGYNIKRVKFLATAPTIEESIDKIFDILRKSTKSIYNTKYALGGEILSEKNLMEKSNKLLRIDLYNYLEKLLGRDLLSEEKQEIGGFFRKAVKNYFETTFINQD